MILNNSLRHVKYNLAFSLALTTQLYAANSPTKEQPIQEKNSSLDETVKPKVESSYSKSIADAKWAPVEITESEQIDTAKISQEEMLVQNKRELWEARLLELNVHYQKLRQQAQADGIELSTPPWDKENNTKNPEQENLERMQSVINAMTPEERDVCITVHRLSMGLMQSSVIPSTPMPPVEPNYNRVPMGYGNYGGGYGRPQAYYNYPNYGYGGGYGNGGYNVSPDWQGGGRW